MPSAPLIPKIPPLRTDIQEPQQSSAVNRPPAQGVSNGANTASNGSAPQHRTSKAWYYYWSKIGEQVVQNTQTLGGLVTYGPHAGRPDPSTMPDGALAVESDRGGVIYQNELIKGVPTWRYAAGTMWGTFSPDLRPTDLGVNDSGFDFRTTDQPPREFIWTGGNWVETTPARYGTHAGRLAVTVANFSQGSLWIETDRGNVVYQLQGTVWKYLSGAMDGTVSPDQRPTDLGANDAGFRFFATDQSQEYNWSGSAWAQIGSPAPPAGLALFARSTASLTLTPTSTAIPGASLTLSRSGTYLITGLYTFNTNDAGVPMRGGLTVGGVDQGTLVIVTGPAGAFISGVQQWLYTLGSGSVVANLMASKDSGAGASVAQGSYTSISAVWIHA